MEISGQRHTPVAFNAQKKHGTDGLLGWVAPVLRLNLLEKRKFSLP
jgi:hypothetical protein